MRLFNVASTTSHRQSRVGARPYESSIGQKNSDKIPKKEASCTLDEMHWQGTKILSNLSFIEMAMVGHWCNINLCALTTSGYQRKVEEFGTERRLKMGHLGCSMEIQWP